MLKVDPVTGVQNVPVTGRVCDACSAGRNIMCDTPVHARDRSRTARSRG